MNKTLVAALAAVTLSIANQSAFADSHPSVKDHGYAAPANWNGAYVGLAVGYATGDADLDRDLFVEPGFNLAVPLGLNEVITTGVDPDGITGTVTLGYDRAFTPKIVAGVFVDYTFGDQNDSGIAPDPIVADFPFSIDIDDAWAVGGRLGYVVRTDTLLYVNAGYTQADIAVTQNGVTLDQDHSGYFIGAGLERQLRTGLNLTLEYRYSDFEDQQIFESVELDGGGAVAARQIINVDADSHAIRLGLSFRFPPRRTVVHQPLK